MRGANGGIEHQTAHDFIIVATIFNHRADNDGFLTQGIQQPAKVFERQYASAVLCVSQVTAVIFEPLL